MLPNSPASWCTQKNILTKLVVLVKMFSIAQLRCCGCCGCCGCCAPLWGVKLKTDQRAFEKILFQQGLFFFCSLRGVCEVKTFSFPQLRSMSSPLPYAFLQRRTVQRHPNRKIKKGDGVKPPRHNVKLAQRIFFVKKMIPILAIFFRYNSANSANRYSV